MNSSFQGQISEARCDECGRLITMRVPTGTHLFIAHCYGYKYGHELRVIVDEQDGEHHLYSCMRRNRLDRTRNKG